MVKNGYYMMITFSALLAICAGNSPVTVNSPHKGLWRGALRFSLIWAWINVWVNNREAGDLRRHRAHYDVIVMYLTSTEQYMYCNQATWHLHVLWMLIVRFERRLLRDWLKYSMSLEWYIGVRGKDSKLNTSVHVTALVGTIVETDRWLIIHYCYVGR